MITKAIEKLISLAKPPTIEIGGVTYWTETERPVHPPQPAILTMSSLSGLVDYIKAGVDSKPRSRLCVQIESPGCVSLFSGTDAGADNTLARLIWAAACLPGKGSMSAFQPDHWLPLEEFIIKLQAQFTDQGQKAAVLQLLGTVTEEVARVAADDGVTQRLTAKAGVALVKEVSIPNPVLLAPFRTFPEVVQPVSPFILRVRGGEQKQAALFEADGGLWMVEAMARIKKWLQDEEIGAEIPILA